MSDLKMHISRPAAWIEVTGDDSWTFLQGQFSNDLKSPAPSPITYGLWLDRKGKVIADSFVLQDSEERMFLYSYYSTAASILERLEPYIIADDVVLRDMTEKTVSATIWGEGLPDALVRCQLERPDKGSFQHWDRCFLLNGRRSRAPNVDLVVVGDDNEQTLAEFSTAAINAGGQLVDEAALEQERIESCIPAVPRDVGPRDLPQEGALDRVALSYTKGCYLGQEVMARIQSMGQVRRGLARIILKQESPELPAPLYAGSREVGSLRSAAGSSSGLGLVRNDLNESQKLSLTPDGPAEVQITRVANS